MTKLAYDLNAEWIESDGSGGFAMGTVGGWRSRRYHALLAAALVPPSSRHVLVNGFDAWVETAAGREPLTTQSYAPDLLAPTGWSALTAFSNEPWPTWRFTLSDGSQIVQELFAVHGAPTIAVGWRLERFTKRGDIRSAKRDAARLIVRPFLSGRDAHALHHANDLFRFEAQTLAAPRGESRLKWQPYASLPAIASVANGTYRHEPHWYHHFQYTDDSTRGFESQESLGSPGEFEFDLARGPAWWIVAQERTVVRGKRGGKPIESVVSPLLAKSGAATLAARLRRSEQKRRAAFATPLDRAASQFVVARGTGKTILAGYPWFTDWGRDTCIAVRGLCLATGRLADARNVLLTWSESLAEGVLPNRFPDGGAPPEFGAADASLWFVVAVEELLAANARAKRSQRVVDGATRERLLAACTAIISSYANGTQHGIRVDRDELLAVGIAADSATPGVAATWMDARIDGRAVTPRVGKPVELQALWWNALTFAARETPGDTYWRKRAAWCRRSFLARFWDAEHGTLHDVVDVDHVAGTHDATFRPNQLFALGGLPRALLTGPRARHLVDDIALRLWTPRGVRTLAPEEPRYCPRYEGGPSQRDAAYHQGTAWPWLLFPLADAWAKSRGGRAPARRKAFARFLAPLREEVEAQTIPHVAELADAQPPHAWKGCPAQAWSLAALLQAEAMREE